MCGLIEWTGLIAANLVRNKLRTLHTLVSFAVAFFFLVIATVAAALVPEFYRNKFLSAGFAPWAAANASMRAAEK
jgi:hypothetical protein